MIRFMQLFSASVEILITRMPEYEKEIRNEVADYKPSS